MTLAIEELNPRVHERKGFDCGSEPLNRYLRDLAVQHRGKGIATTFVLIDDADARTVLGFYSLSAASLTFETIAESDRKQLPAYPIPSVRIGRLGVSLSAKGRGFGELLLQNAIKRTLAARRTMGVFALIVDAKDDKAAAFYRKYGFRSCNMEDRQLYLPLGKDEA